MNQDSSRSHSVFTITVEIGDPQQNGEVRSSVAESLFRSLPCTGQRALAA